MEKSIFINVSNHPSDRWNADQYKAAERYGEVVDFPFPEVDPSLGEEEVRELAERTFARIMDNYGDCVGNNTLTVMVQGEFTLTYALIRLLKEVNANVVAACSARVVCEERMKDGTARKVAEFKFIRFRRYL